MKKKGFTLIELLAVIIVLGVIALIAVPIVTDLIAKIKIKAAINSTYGYVEAANNAIALESLKSNEVEGEFEVNDTPLNIKVKGTKPESGTLLIVNKEVSTANLCVNGYEIKYENNKAEYIENGILCGGNIVVHKPVEMEGTYVRDLCLGTEYDVNETYKVKIPEDLQCLATQVNNGNSFNNSIIYLVEDINMNNIEMTPIGNNNKPFKGVFNGQNYFTISNINITGGDYTGLFGFLSTPGRIEGLKLKDITVKGSSYIGGLVGYNQGIVKAIEIDNSYVEGSSYVGGLTGFVYSSNKVSTVIINNQEVKGSSFVGGITGQNSGQITSTILRENKVTGTNYTGGLVGESYGTLTGVNESGSINSNANYHGRCIGSGNTTNVRCYTSNSVTGNESSGYSGTIFDTSDIGNLTKYNQWISLDIPTVGDIDSDGYIFDYEDNNCSTIKIKTTTDSFIDSCY